MHTVFQYAASSTVCMSQVLIEALYIAVHFVHISWQDILLYLCAYIKSISASMNILRVERVSKLMCIDNLKQMW